MMAAEILSIVGLSSAGAMAAGGLMAETEPAAGIAGGGSVYIALGAAGGILSGLGILFDKWSKYDLSKRESDRLDKTSRETLAAIEARATAAEKATEELKKELENSKNNWHEERRKYGDQLDRAYEIVEKVSNQLAALDHRAKANKAMIDETRKEIDLPPLSVPSPETPK